MGESWRVRGHMGTDLQPGTRFRHGLEKAAARLETTEVAITLLLLADGNFEVRVAKTGKAGSKTILKGTLEIANGGVAVRTLERVQ